MRFPKESAFARENQRQEIERPSLARREVHPEQSALIPLENQVISTHPRGTDGILEAPPLDHWHHDLTTVDILLDQQPPDVDRARRLLQDLAHEVYSHMRG